MSLIRSILVLLAAGICAALAAPARAQQPSVSAPYSLARPAAPLLPAALAPHADAIAAQPLSANAGRRLSVAAHAGIGALTGAGLATVATLGWMAMTPGCRQTGSMCGLAIPIVAGGGALAGGTVGLGVGLVRNR